MMPPRGTGGRTYKQGGGVNGYTPTQSGTPVFRESLKSATPVSHVKEKGVELSPKNLDRGRQVTFKAGGKVVTFKTGGKVFSGNVPGGVGVKDKMAPNFHAGASGGEARLKKEKRAAKLYKKAV
jgi:hypothetical protein